MRLAPERGHAAVMALQQLLLVSGTVAVAVACSTSMDCSLNGACTNGSCQCDAPWSGASCGILDIAPAAPGGAYGFGTPWAVTSWGGNVLANAGKYHLYVTEIAGARCGLGRWGNQSTVAHAVADSIDGPYNKAATVIQHEAHNPQAIEFDGSFYVFHIGSGASKAPVADCSNSVTAAAATAAPRRAGGSAPPATAGSTVHKAASPDGPFLPVEALNIGSCNNPSPFRHKNGTLFLVCTWSIKSAPKPEGPWSAPVDIKPPPNNARHWEDPFLFINDRGFHILSHIYSSEPHPSAAAESCLELIMWASSHALRSQQWRRFQATPSPAMPFPRTASPGRFPTCSRTGTQCHERTALSITSRQWSARSCSLGTLPTRRGRRIF